MRGIRQSDHGRARDRHSAPMIDIERDRAPYPVIGIA